LAFIGGGSAEGSVGSRWGGAPPGREVLSFAAQLFHTEETVPTLFALPDGDRDRVLCFAPEIATWLPNHYHGQ
jgi:hypothetical protein